MVGVGRRTVDGGHLVDVRRPLGVERHVAGNRRFKFKVLGKGRVLIPAVKGVAGLAGGLGRIDRRADGHVLRFHGAAVDGLEAHGQQADRDGDRLALEIVVVLIAHILVIYRIAARVLAGRDLVAPGLAVETVLHLRIALGQGGGSRHQRLVGVVRHKVRLRRGLLCVGGRARGPGDDHGLAAADHIGVIVAGDDVEVYGVLARVGIGRGCGAARRGVVLCGQFRSCIINRRAGRTDVHGNAVGIAVIAAGIAGGGDGEAGLGDCVFALHERRVIVCVIIGDRDLILAHVGGLGRCGVQRHAQLVPVLVCAADGIGQLRQVVAVLAALVIGGDRDGGLVDREVRVGEADRVVIPGGEAAALGNGVGSGVLARSASQRAGQCVAAHKTAGAVGQRGVGLAVGLALRLGGHGDGGFGDRKVGRGLAAVIVVGFGNGGFHRVIARVGRNRGGEVRAALGRVAVAHRAAAGIAADTGRPGRLAVGPAGDADVRVDTCLADAVRHAGGGVAQRDAGGIVTRVGGGGGQGIRALLVDDARRRYAVDAAGDGGLGALAVAVDAMRRGIDRHCGGGAAVMPAVGVAAGGRDGRAEGFIAPVVGVAQGPDDRPWAGEGSVVVRFPRQALIEGIFRVLRQPGEGGTLLPFSIAALVLAVFNGGQRDAANGYARRSRCGGVGLIGLADLHRGIAVQRGITVRRHRIIDRQGAFRHIRDGGAGVERVRPIVSEIFDRRVD